jgi:hypothetical protein
MNPAVSSHKDLPGFAAIDNRLDNLTTELPPNIAFSRLLSGVYVE